jgi:hypothetical protein
VAAYQNVKTEAGTGNVVMRVPQKKMNLNSLENNPGFV